MAFCPNLRFLVCLLKEKDIEFLQLFDLNLGKDISYANPQSPTTQTSKSGFWASIFPKRQENIKPSISIKLERSRGSILLPKCSVSMETDQFGKIFVTNSSGQLSVIQIRKCTSNKLIRESIVNYRNQSEIIDR